MGDPGAFRRRLPVLFLLLAGLQAAMAGAQTPTRVTNLNTTVPGGGTAFNYYKSFESLGNALFVVIDDETHGSEFRRIDGTSASTHFAVTHCRK
jgi:hypothetical protein